MEEVRGSVPVPDPTKLTTDAVNAAKADIEKLFDEKLKGLRELFTEKIEGRDTALAAALKSAQELIKQQNDSNTLAVDKSADAFTKQIDSLDARISDIKEGLAEIRRKEWSTVGGYIVGAVGIVALILTALRWHT